METLAEIPYLISVVTFLPVIGLLLVLVLPDENAIRWTALTTTIVTFVVSLGLWIGFDSTVAGAQMVNVSGSWLAGMDVKYFIGVDGLNLLLILLTTLLGPIVVLCSWTYITKHVRGYFALLLLLQTGIVSVFASFDLLLFYVFFELAYRFRRLRPAVSSMAAAWSPP